MGVRFHLNSRSPSDRNAVSVRLVVMRGQSQIKLSTPIRVRPSDWARKQQRVRASVPGSTELNGALARLKTDAERLLLDCPTEAELREALLKRLGRTTEGDGPDLLELFDQFVDNKRTRCRPSTMQTYEAVRGHLQSFLEGRSASPSDIGPGWLDDFAGMLVAQGLQNSTANKIQTRVRGFLRWLVDRELLDRVPTSKPLPTVQNAVFYLTAGELDRLAALDLSDHQKGYRAARDLFIFGAVTGQRFGDLQALRWSDLYPQAHPTTWSLTVKKTGDVIRVPLTSPAVAILEQRRGQSRPLPRLSNQRANQCIKAVCELAGIDDPVTTHRVKGGERIVVTVPKFEAVGMHAARRTFVTLALQSGLEQSELLGFTHADLKTLKAYAGRDQARLTKGMKLAFDGVAVRAA